MDHLSSDGSSFCVPLCSRYLWIIGLWPLCSLPILTPCHYFVHTFSSIFKLLDFLDHFMHSKSLVNWSFMFHIILYNSDALYECHLLAPWLIYYIPYMFTCIFCEPIMYNIFQFFKKISSVILLNNLADYFGIFFNASQIGFVRLDVWGDILLPRIIYFHWFLVSFCFDLLYFLRFVLLVVERFCWQCDLLS